MSTRNEKRIEFGRRDDASELREELSDETLAADDDGREKVLRLDPDAIDERTRRRVEGKAAVSRDDARGDMHGQASLTEGEKDRLDFTRTTVPEARTAKASLLAEGVSDWTAHFDPSLTTSEMADVARSSTAGGGERMDSADTQRARDRQGANMFREVQSQQAKRARDGCEEGFEEACDQLVEEFGFSRAEAEALLENRQQPAQAGRGVTADGGLRDTTVLRASAPGTFLRQPPEPADDAPGYRNGSSGRFVGYEIDEHDEAKRNPENGRIKTLGPGEPVPRDEAINRWGRPDGIDGDPTPTPDRPSRTDTLDALGADVPGGRMTPDEDVTAQASAFDVSLAPDEARESGPAGAVGTTALGGFKPAFAPGEEGGEQRPTELDNEPDELFARDLERERRMDAAGSAGALEPGGGDPFEFGADVAGDDDPFEMDMGTDAPMTDDRDQQASFDVGIDAGATRDREGQVAGSAGFADRRDELGTTGAPDTGEQSGLVEMETDVGGDGQTDLFGGDASQTTGGEYRI